jgi:hypothetical protein
MPEGKRWRVARFQSEELRTEFIAHALALGIDGLEVEPIDDQREVRFRAPTEVEVGIANMIGAHAGKVIPAGPQEQEFARVGSASI